MDRRTLISFVYPPNARFDPDPEPAGGTATAELPAAPAQTAEQQMDAALDAALDKVAPAEEKPIDVPWRKKPDAPADDKAEVKDESKTEPKGEETPKGEPEAAPRTKDKREQIALAKQRLRKDNVPEDEISALTPAKLLAWAERIAPRQDETDKVFKERTTKSAPSDRSRGRSATEPPTGDAGGNPAEASPFDETVARLREIDSDLADQLDSTLKARETAHKQERDTAIKEAQERADKALIAAHETRLTHHRDRLAERFPGLKDDSRYVEVLDRMKSWDRTGEYALGPDDRFGRFFEDACWVEFGPEVERTTREQLVAGNQRTRNAMMDMPAPPGGTQAITQDQYDDMVLEAVADARGDKAELARLMAMIPKPVK